MLYERYCAAYHAPEGQGRVQGKATRLDNPDFLALASDAFLHATIAYGRRGTPMFPSLCDLNGVRQLSTQEIYDIVAYLRSRQRQK